MICDIHGCELEIEKYYLVTYCPMCSMNPRNENADEAEVRNIMCNSAIVQIDLDAPSLN